MINLPKNESQVNDDERYEVFVRLVMKHEPRVRSFLRGLLPTWHDVEEVAQEASLIAWRKFDDFEEGTSFGGWLLTIARFEALKYRRRVARSPLVFVDEVWDQLAEEASGEEDQQIRRQHLEICLRSSSAEMFATGILIANKVKKSVQIFCQWE